MKKAKYKNYAELSVAFKSGELDRSHYSIVLDKGGMQADLRYYNDKLSEKENEREQEKCRSIFKPEYADHIDDLYVALGIPCEWC